jgi:transcriptional regulator with XRE-family HTH domain
VERPMAAESPLGRALLGRSLDSMESLANAVVISRSTASRFFSGRPTSLAVTLRILGALHVTFEDVATQVDDTDEPEGPSSAGARPRPTPPSPQPGSTVELRRQAG